MEHASLRMRSDISTRCERLQAAGCWRSGGIYRSLPPNVSSSAFYTIYRIPRSRRTPHCTHLHEGAVVCSVDGKRYGLTLALLPAVKFVATIPSVNTGT